MVSLHGHAAGNGGYSQGDTYGRGWSSPTRRVKTLRDQGKSLKEVLGANLTAPYDKTTQGDTQQSKDRFITEAYDEVKDFPPVVDGKRTMPTHP